ncbi:hypothetical protein [Rhizorhabdus dicambivorans]|uniref:Uncharacterized protein n=1 Tax=Rhizorhabdus dicambivorans TaxID=1850238 RepID=A0A2A4FUJ8_9SPHN|nr:hypothetical protein [Rhizorhabdus dicambivorans]ATE65515.1 hypothetical protein CMV14_14795 [Rhizorhabdus dicambivorans]PCE41857.1 hypothetical protein COO09_12545 [Rhizorhabdus dicambivorans]
MQHDLRLRAAARAVYDAVYPTDELAPVGFDQAEQYGTIHYRRCIEAARACFFMKADKGEQLPLI